MPKVAEGNGRYICMVCVAERIIGVCVRVCVFFFLTTIDRANRVTNENKSVFLWLKLENASKGHNLCVCDGPQHNIKKLRFASCVMLQDTLRRLLHIDKYEELTSQ